MFLALKNLVIFNFILFLMVAYKNIFQLKELGLEILLFRLSKILATVNHK